MLKRADEGVLDRLLGDVDVAEEADQAGDRPSGFLPEDASDGVGVDVGTAQDSTGGSSWNGRTSTLPWQAAAPSLAQRRAASRSGWRC